MSDDRTTVTSSELSLQNVPSDKLILSHETVITKDDKTFNIVHLDKETNDKKFAEDELLLLNKLKIEVISKQSDNTSNISQAESPKEITVSSTAKLDQNEPEFLKDSEYKELELKETEAVSLDLCIQDDSKIKFLESSTDRKQVESHKTVKEKKAVDLNQHYPEDVECKGVDTTKDQDICHTENFNVTGKVEVINKISDIEADKCVVTQETTNVVMYDRSTSQMKEDSESYTESEPCDIKTSSVTQKLAPQTENIPELAPNLMNIQDISVKTPENFEVSIQETMGIEMTKGAPVVTAGEISSADTQASLEIMLDKNMCELRNISHELVAFQELSLFCVSSNISIQRLENHIKFLQQLESLLICYKSRIGSIETVLSSPQHSSDLTHMESLTLLRQTITQIDVLYESLLIQIKENQTLLKSLHDKDVEAVSQTSEKQLEISSQPHQNINKFICHLEDLMIFIQKYFQVCNVTSRTTKEETRMLCHAETTSLKRLLCLNKVRQLPSNQDYYQTDRRIQDNYVSSLPVSCFLPNVEFEKIVFEQRLEEILDSLCELTKDAKKLERVEDVEYYYIQIVQTIYQWIEYVEHWILKVHTLSVEQHTEQCKLIEKELFIIHQNLLKVNDLTENISSTFPEDVRRSILDSLLNLQHQIDSTKDLANGSFDQISSWSAEKARIDNEFERINSHLSTSKKKLEGIHLNKQFIISEVKPLKLALVEYCSKYENLCSEKLKLSLKWPGYKAENLDDSIYANHNMKLLAYQMYDKAISAEQAVHSYRFSSESLTRLCDVLESFFQHNLCISDVEQLNKIYLAVKDSLIFLELLSFRCKENFMQSKLHLDPETSSEYDTLISRADNISQLGKDRIKTWQLCHMYISELEKLIHSSSKWLKEKYEISKDHPCPKKDLPEHIAFFKDLQHEIKDHSHQTKRIMELQSKMNASLTYPAFNDIVTDFLLQYQEFQETIDARVHNVQLFLKQWSQFEDDLKALQRWLSESELRLKYIQHQMRNESDLPAVFENTRSILRLESETQCKEESYEKVKNAIEQSITLHIFDESGLNILNCINQKWNEIVQNVSAIETALLSTLKNYRHTEIRKQLNLWMTDIQKSYKIYSTQDISSISDLHQLKHELRCWVNDTTTMERIYHSLKDTYDAETTSTPEFSSMADENEYLLAEQLQSLKIKLIIYLENVHFFINKCAEFEEISMNLLHSYEIMQSHLDKINESNMKSNRYALINNLDEIQKYKTELKEGEDKFQNLMKMVPVICDKTHSEGIKNNILCKYNILNQYYLSLQSSIEAAEVTSENNIKLWNKYHEDLELCYQYLTEQETSISIYDGCILNLQHLQQTIPKLETAFQQFENNKILNNVLNSSDAVRKCSNAGIQLELESDRDVLQTKWNSLKGNCNSLIENEKVLEKEWSIYTETSDSLSDWISSMQNYVMNIHLNALCTSTEYEICLEELSKKKLKLLSLKETGEQLCCSQHLHKLAKKNIEMSFYSLYVSIQFLEKAMLHCQEVVLDCFEDKQCKEKQIQNIQAFLDNLDMTLYDVVPSEKQELEAYRVNIEQILLKISQHYADLLQMKENLIFRELSDFTVIKDITHNLSRIQDITSRLCSHYLKLTEVTAKNNTFVENCTLLLQLLDKFKRIHAMKVSSDYWHLMLYFLKAQIMEIFINSHQIILQEVISSDALNSSFDSQFGTQNLYNSLCEFVNEWDSLETAYRHKMTLVKEQIYLWQNYLYHFFKVSSSLKVIRSQIVERTFMSNIYDINEELSWIQEVHSQLVNDLNEINLIRSAADELLDNLKDTRIEEIVRTPNSNIQHQIKIEIENLLTRRVELEEMNQAFKNLTSDLEISQEKLSSVQLYVTQDIPSSFKELKKELNEAEVKKVSNKEAIEILSSMKVDKLNNERTNIQKTIEEQKSAQYNMANIMQFGLDQRISLVCGNLDKLPAFDKKYMYLMKWCNKMEQKINQQYLDSPENAVNRFNSIKEEINCMESEFEDAINLGNSLSSDKKVSKNVSEKLSTLKSAWSCVIDLQTKRLEILRTIIKLVEKITEKSEILSNFLATKNSTELSHHWKELSFENVENKLKNIQAVENEISSVEDVVPIIQNLLDELNSYKEDFNSSFKQNALQYSLSILHRWALFKEFITKQNSSLLNLRVLWEEFLKALKNLEDWLTSKENIADAVNYAEPGHSRNTYLEGIGVFENLKHSFEDNIYLLHSVNSSFHNMNQKDFNITSSLKNRVLSANDRWHKLYDRVVKVFDTIKDILQIWDNFDQQKGHLLLFLTESDLKLTDMETMGQFHKADFENIEENFKLHEDERERYISTSKHLMKQSECSISTIQASVDEVESYWDELYRRLQSLKAVQENPIEKKQNIVQYSETKLLSEDAEIDVSLEKTVEEGRDSDSSADDGNIDQNLSHKRVAEKLKLLSETDSYDVQSKTYSNVVAMSSKKEEETKVQFEQVAKKFVSKRAAESESKISFEKPSVTYTTPSKQSSFDDDCIKDLLAALKEAEERMDVLEKVLCELTPSGIDEQGPNYSHLLAACRSSVDVIQHLSQFLFYEVPDEGDKPGKTEIKLQSEDLLQRWQRIENLALNKECRVMENRKSWDKFTKELKGFETWVQKALQDYSSESCTDADIEKLVLLLQKHKELISQIRAQKKIILTLNVTGQKFLSASSSDNVKTASLKQRIKTVNDHWDNLYSTALFWQSKLQSEILQSAEFQSTIDEMRSWLKESERRIEDMSQMKEKSDSVLHEHHTELYALKQQLEAYCNRLETLHEITLHLFMPELKCGENPSLSEESLLELQTKLQSNLKFSRSLLIKCTEMLKSISSLLGFSKFREHVSLSRNGAASASNSDGESSSRSECCSFLMRVARASFPIQAILLLLLGAAILLPMEEEEELSCRLSNNFASSLNPMLRYPDGPPPV